MFNLFKRKEEPNIKESIKKDVDVCVDEYSKALMIKNLQNINISLKDLYIITQEAKKEMNYNTMDNADKYLVNNYQDLILFIARDFRNLHNILPKE